MTTSRIAHIIGFNLDRKRAQQKMAKLGNLDKKLRTEEKTLKTNCTVSCFAMYS